MSILWETASAVVMVGHVVTVLLHVVHQDVSVVAPAVVDSIAVLAVVSGHSPAAFSRLSIPDLFKEPSPH